MLIAQRRCMKYSQPPTRIMFDSDPSRTAVLLSQGYGQPPNFFWVGNTLPSYCFYPATKDAFDAFETASANLDNWRNPPAPNAGWIFANSPPDFSTNSAVFLHERRSPSGHIRLIQCSTSVTDAGGDPIQLTVSAIEPASLTGLRKNCRQNAPLSFLRAGDQRWLRLFAGQPDSDDASRFTIRYETNNGTGLIEEMLADDDGVQLRILSDPLPTLLLGPASAPANAVAHRVQ